MEYDLTVSNMRMEATKISSKLIHAHMSNTSLNLTNLVETNKYQVALYDKSRIEQVGNMDENIDFSKEQYVKNDNLYLIDDSSLGHLGIYHIVIKDINIKDNLLTLKVKIFISFIVAYLFISIIGIFLLKIILRPMQKEKERLNTFIKDTTHELNTPITAILMCTSNPKGINEKNFNRINLSARRISEIYNDLTFLFLKDVCENKKNLEEIELSSILTEQLEYFKELASKKHIEILVDVKKCYRKMDKESFIRLSNNLISNAIKYNKVSGSISIKLDNEKFIVSDTGIGIKKDKQKDIFKRFFRANDVQGGFGIGLSIVYEICKEYNIDIDMKSIEHKGTVFTLRFN